MSDPIVTTTCGQIRGLDQPNGVAFQGVPFAAPPVGTRRFRPPAPPEPWVGVRDGSKVGAACPQPEQPDLPIYRKLTHISERQEEDCLYLNVWTPAADDARRPVMVWIHGGAFRIGSGSSWPFQSGSFSRDGVVLVTINYRLHAFGHLYLDDLFEDAEGSGNAGILDQIAALEWVRDNIAAFGGDPENVTVFGESAGGSSTTILMGSARTTGLFHRAIAMSGYSYCTVTPERATRVTEAFLGTVGVAPGDWQALFAIPTERIVAAASLPLLPEYEAFERVPMDFLPVVDGRLIEQSPLVGVRAGNAGGVDLLVGCTTEEWRPIHFAVPGLFPAPDLPALCAGNGVSPDDVLPVYERSLLSADSTDCYAALDADLMFSIPATHLAEAQLANHDRVWQYRFAWRSPVAEGAFGAFHALDVPFVFDALDDPDMLGNGPSEQLADAMHGAWARFAETGDPSGGALPDWPTYDAERRSVMVFDEKPYLADDPDGDRRRLWQGLSTWAPT